MLSQGYTQVCGGSLPIQPIHPIHPIQPIQPIHPIQPIQPFKHAMQNIV